MDHPERGVNDNELTDLLESAFNDFFKPTGSSAPGSSSSQAYSSSSSTGPGARTFGQLPGMSSFGQMENRAKLMGYKDEDDEDEGEDGEGDGEDDKDFEKSRQRIDEILTDFIEKEPQLREQWEKLNESCQLTDNSEQAFDTLSDTLKSLAESAKSVNEDGEISEEELSRLWGKLGVKPEGTPGEEGLVPEMFSLVTNLMQNLLSKQVLYPSIKDLSSRYPVWIDEHRHELESKDLDRYSKQLELMQQVCIEFEAESESDSQQIRDARFAKILKIMQDMKDCGPPPKDLVGDVPDLGSDMDLSKLSELTGGAPGQEQGCSLM